MLKVEEEVMGIQDEFVSEDGRGMEFIRVVVVHLFFSDVLVLVDIGD